MEKWLLVVAGEKANFVDAQKAWLKKSMYLTIVPALKDVARRLLDRDYLAVVAFTANPSTVSPFFAEIRRIKPNIPILFMPSNHGKNPEEITRQLDSVVEMVELGSPEQQAALEAPDMCPAARPLTCLDLSVYPQFRIVLFHGQEVRLSRCQFDALTALMESRGRLLTFDQLYDRVYGEFTEAGNAYGSTRYFIAEIRRRLSEIAEFDYIENIRGVGYRIRFERAAQ